jgi:hypothetical protein
MSGSAHSYEKMVLSHLEKVGQLPPEVQADIAKRVGTYLKLASAAKTDELLAALKTLMSGPAFAGDVTAATNQAARKRVACGMPTPASVRKRNRNC